MESAEGGQKYDEVEGLGIYKTPQKEEREKDRGQTYMAALSGEDPTKTRWKAKETTTVASSWQRSTKASRY